jgi:uncharacterized coiled-coil DUF342 family protein
MLNKVDSLEMMIDRVAEVIQSLRDERDQIAEELEVVREVLDEKEKETASLREERAVLEQRLTALLDKMHSSYGKEDDSKGMDGEDQQTEDADPSPGEYRVRQGELTDRF